MSSRARDPIWVTQDYLRARLHYDPSTGTFTWLVKANNNGANAGDVAGSVGLQGYRVIGLGGRTIHAHRLAFFYMTGRWPVADLDHANGDRVDNRWGNLREATRSQNCANKRVRHDSATGVKGVQQHRYGGYVAAVSHAGRRQHLGVFDSLEAAAGAYAARAREVFGEFARPSRRNIGAAS